MSTAQPITKIYLDLDGVCNRMIMHALEINGCRVSRYNDAAWPLPGCYDFAAAARKLSPGRKWSHDLIWYSVPFEVWASTPPSLEFGYLLSACQHLVGQDNIAFLTKPTGAESAGGKVAWIERFAPIWLHDKYTITKQKADLAKPDRLLIDDSDAEVNAFREAGGLALLVPRPWNSLWKVEPLKYLAQFFDSLQPQPTSRSPEQRSNRTSDFASLRQCGLLRELSSNDFPILNNKAAAHQPLVPDAVQIDGDIAPTSDTSPAMRTENHRETILTFPAHDYGESPMQHPSPN